MKKERIRSGVREKYSRVAIEPEGEFGFPVGGSFAEQVGYPPDLLARMPGGSVESFAGLSDTVLHAEIAGGEYVLDLGCGAGLDVLIVSEQVGAEGFVTGLDYSPQMAFKAWAGCSGKPNVGVVIGEGESLPFADRYFHLVVSNGILNLAPSKPDICREVYRVLKPGGRFLYSEIVLREGVEPPPAGDDGEDWFR